MASHSLPLISSSSSSSCMDKLLMRFYTFLNKLVFRPDYTVNRCLLNLLDRKVPPSSKPFHGIISSDINPISSIPHLWIRLYTPLLSPTHILPLPLVVFFHGGGFVMGSPASSPVDSFNLDFARELNSIVVSVNYRLAPEHRFPCQYDDGFHILKLIDDGLISDALPPNVDFTRCFVSGESAGGNIAHHVTVKAAGYQFKRLKIVGVIAIEPFFGGEERTESELRFRDNPALTLEMSDWYWKAYLPVGSNRDHPAANVVGSNAVDISGLNFPASLVIVGGSDLLRDRDREYCEWLKKSGKEVKKMEYPNATHGISSDSHSPEYSMLMHDAGEFLKKHANP